VAVSKTLILTSHPREWHELAAITCATHAKYADAQGYDYHADCSNLSAPNTLPWWGEKPKGAIPIRGFRKLDLMLYYLDPEKCGRQYDWVVWLDADLLVTNYAIPIAKWTDQTPCGLVLPYDANGHNATVIMAKNTDLTYDFLWACNNAGRTMFIRHDWAEMEAMRYFLQTPPYDYLATYFSVKALCGMPRGQYPIPGRVMDKYTWAPGDFALHLSALSLEKRIGIASYIVEELKLL
jgi:hypothetical protein